MTIIQLVGCDGQPLGLYQTNRTDTENFQYDFDAALSDLDIEDIQGNADDWLAEYKHIYRIKAEEVTTNYL